MSHERVWAWVTHPEAKMENIWVFSIFGWKIFAYLHQLWQVKASTNNLLSFNRKGYSYFLQSIVIIGLIFYHLIYPWSAGVISQDKRKKNEFCVSYSYPAAGSSDQSCQAPGGKCNFVQDCPDWSDEQGCGKF